MVKQEVIDKLCEEAKKIGKSIDDLTLYEIMAILNAKFHDAGVIKAYIRIKKPRCE